MSLASYTAPVGIKSRIDSGEETAPSAAPPARARTRGAAPARSRAGLRLRRPGARLRLRRPAPGLRCPSAMGLLPAEDTPPATDRRATRAARPAALSSSSDEEEE